MAKQKVGNPTRPALS